MVDIFNLGVGPEEKSLKGLGGDHDLTILMWTTSTGRRMKTIVEHKLRVWRTWWTGTRNYDSDDDDDDDTLGRHCRAAIEGEGDKGLGQLGRNLVR
jgi:hypothetical protein